MKYSNTSRKLVLKETRDHQDLRASDAFLAAPSPCSIFYVLNFSLILILLCDLISIYAREYRVFFSRGEGSGKVLIDYDLSEFADVEHLQRCGKHSTQPKHPRSTLSV